MIRIKGIMYGAQKIGISLQKLVPGDNDFEITVEDRFGDLLYPGVFTINKEDAIKKYGISVINRRHLEGIWVPLSDLVRKQQALSGAGNS